MNSRLLLPCAGMSEDCTNCGGLGSLRVSAVEVAIAAGPRKGGWMKQLLCWRLRLTWKNYKRNFEKVQHFDNKRSIAAYFSQQAPHMKHYVESDW